MSSSHPSPQLGSRKRKIHHILDSSEEEKEAFMPLNRKRSLKPSHGGARQFATNQGTPVTTTLTPSPQTQSLPTFPTDPTLEPALTHGKSASLRIHSPECLPKQEEDVAPIGQHEPSPPEDIDSPPRTPFEFVYQDLVDDDFGRRVCEAYKSSQ